MLVSIISFQHRSNVLFACLSSSWANTMGRLLGLKMVNCIRDALSNRESN